MRHPAFRGLYKFIPKKSPIRSHAVQSKQVEAKDIVPGNMVGDEINERALHLYRDIVGDKDGIVFRNNGRIVKIEGTRLT